NIGALVASAPGVEQLAQRDQQRRHAAEAQLAVDALGEPPDRSQARLAPCLGERLREHDPSLRAQPAAEAIDQLACGEAVIPDVEVALVGEAPHALAVLTHAVTHDPLTTIGWQPHITAGDLGAGRHSLEVPLPRAGQSLVEVVGTEYEPAIWSRESAEVRDVGITASLHRNARIRRNREVG